MGAQTIENSPQGLAARVERLVRSRTSGMIYGLHVEVLGDQLVLSGRTATYYSKQLASHAAMIAAEDLVLTNSIEVLNTP